MKSIKQIISFVLISLIIISTVGCSKPKDTKKDTASSKYLKIAEDVDLITIDKDVAVDGLSFEEVSDTNEGLFIKNGQGKLVPALASSHTVSKDGLTYTFKLRDAKWSNGDKITANDFVYSWRRIVDPKVASEYSFIAQVAGIKNAGDIVAGKKPKEELGVTAKDAHTLVVQLERPVAFFLSLTAFPSFVPLNEKFVTEQGANYGTSPSTVLSSGPYKLKSWNKGYGFVVEKNPNYYDVKNVKLAGIDYRTIKENQTAALKFDSNELDIVKISAELVDKYKNNKAFKQIKDDFVWYAAFNEKDEVFKNVNARKAVQHAINKKYIVNTILNDGSKVANYLVPVGLGTGPDNKDFRSSAPSNYGEYDVTAAKKYWETAKKELGKSNVQIELLYDDSDTVKQTAEYIQAQLETNLPGLKVTLKSQPKKNRGDLMKKGEYQVALTRWGPDYDDPLTYLDLFLTGSTYDNINYSNTTYDKLVKSSSTDLATDAKGRWKAMINAEKILLGDDAAIAPLYQTGSTYLINTNITGLSLPNPPTSGFIYKYVEFKK